jgi:hypothetical protein
MTQLQLALQLALKLAPPSPSPCWTFCGAAGLRKLALKSLLPTDPKPCFVAPARLCVPQASRMPRHLSAARCRPAAMELPGGGPRWHVAACRLGWRDPVLRG